MLPQEHSIFGGRVDVGNGTVSLSGSRTWVLILAIGTWQRVSASYEKRVA